MFENSNHKQKEKEAMVQSGLRMTLQDLLSTPVTADELDEPFKVNEENVDFLEKFEKAWNEFVMKQAKESLPKGERECRIEKLQVEAREIQTYKENLEGELKEQRDFIRNSLQKSEEAFHRRVRAEKRAQRAIHIELSQQLEYAEKVHVLQKDTLPWFHFLEQLNDKAERDEERISHGLSNSITCPSKRGFLLSRVKDQDDSSPAAQLRACKTDHAIMDVHINMLAKEIERCEKLSCLREYASTFLNEQDVSSILKGYERDASTMTTDITESTVEEKSRHSLKKPPSMAKTSMTGASDKTAVDEGSYFTPGKATTLSEAPGKTNTENQSSLASDIPPIDKKVKTASGDEKKKRAKGKVTKADEEILMALEKTLKTMGSMTDLEETVKENKKEKTADVSWSAIRNLLAH